MAVAGCQCKNEVQRLENNWLWSIARIGAMSLFFVFFPNDIRAAVPANRRP